jgi:hypothetical protein
MTNTSHQKEAGTPPRVAVVGPCASGKSTLVAALRERGFDAVVIGQEHSIVHRLWARGAPDVLIALTVDIETIRRRRDPGWSAELLRTQQQRLAEAYAEADLILDSTRLDRSAMIDHAVRWLTAHHPRPGRA